MFSHINEIPDIPMGSFSSGGRSVHVGYENLAIFSQYLATFRPRHKIEIYIP